MANRAEWCCGLIAQGRVVFDLPVLLPDEEFIALDLIRGRRPFKVSVRDGRRDAAALWLTLLGACVGSFTNVVVWRLPRGESVVFPGSHCPRCGHAMRWHDNLPVLGWLLLMGRCRDCQSADQLALSGGGGPAAQALAECLAVAGQRRRGSAAVERGCPGQGCRWWPCCCPWC